MQYLRFPTSEFLNPVAVTVEYFKDRQSFRTLRHQCRHLQCRPECHESVEPDVIFAPECAGIRERSSSDQRLER